MRSALLSLALALPLPLYAALGADPAQDRRQPAQEPVAQEPVKGEPQEDEDKGEEVDIFGRLRSSQAKTGTSRLLQGCWKLTEIELAEVVESGRKAVGALLVHDGFLAFELHMAWPGDRRAPTLHQSFIAEYEFTKGRLLQVTTVIGSFLDQRFGVLDWEQPSFVREYQVSVSGDRLVLTFGQGNKMTFVRQRASGKSSRDIFGRERSEPVGDRDIFGRPKTPTESAETPKRDGE